MIIACNILKTVDGLVGDFDNCMICLILITKKWNIVETYQWNLTTAKTESVEIHIHTIVLIMLKMKPIASKKKKGEKEVVFRFLRVVVRSWWILYQISLIKV